MKNRLKCLSEREMIGANILSVDYNSDRLLITTDKGLICVAAIEDNSEWEDDVFEHYLYLQEELVIGWDSKCEYQCAVDIDEAVELNLITQAEADSIHTQEAVQNALQYKKNKLERCQQLKDELEKLEKELE